MDLIRMGIVYLHLIACCVAIGVVFMSDIDMVQRLLKADPADRLKATHLTDLQTTVARALFVLWITGVAIVLVDALDKGWGVLGNPKLQAKIAIVMLLTFNGVVLHRYVMPLLQRAGSLMRLSFTQRLRAIFAGAVSGVSWFYAAMLGIGRPLNWKYTLTEILAAYPVLIGGGFVAMVLLTVWSQYKLSSTARSYQGTVGAH